MSLPDRIAFTGKMGVGKSYSAALLEAKGWEIVRFADPLKAAARQFQDAPTRQLLQELARVSRSVEPRPLVERMRERLEQVDESQKLVVDDARFPDELDLLWGAGFTVVRLTAPVHVRLERLHANGRCEHPAQLQHESEVALDSVGLPELSCHETTDEDLLERLEVISEWEKQTA